MADRLMDGRLAEQIATFRQVRAPWPAIADHLHDNYGVEVTADTLRSWAIKLGVQDGPKAEAAS